MWTPLIDSTRLNFSGGMKAFDENSKFIMDEVLDREHVESAKNGMMFLPLEAEKLQKVRTVQFLAPIYS